MQLPTDWPGLFAAVGFQLGTVRDIQAQTLPTWQHVRAVDEPRQHNHAACPDNEGLCRDPLDDLLEVAYISGPDLQ